MNLKSLVENGFPIGEKPGRIPFTHSLGTDTFRDPMTRKRLAETLSIIEEFEPRSSISAGRISSARRSARFSRRKPDGN